MTFNQTLILIIAGLYYVIAGIFLLFSLFTVYIFLRYGRTRTITLATSIIYALFFISILSVSLATLQSVIRSLYA
jgi:hypothetical protein